MAPLRQLLQEVEELAGDLAEITDEQGVIIGGPRAVAGPLFGLSLGRQIEGGKPPRRRSRQGIPDGGLVTAKAVIT